MEELSWKNRKLSQDWYLEGILCLLGIDNEKSKNTDRLYCIDFGEILKKTLCFDYTSNEDYIAEISIIKNGLFMDKIDFVIDLLRRNIYISTLEFTIRKNRISKAKLYDGSGIKRNFDIKLQRRDIRSIYYSLLSSIDNRSRNSIYINLNRILFGIDSNNEIINLYKELIRPKY